MKRYLSILFILFLLVSCKPSAEPFVVSEGGRLAARTFLGGG